MNDTVIKVTDATVRFNMATESFNGLKEYIIKMLKGDLMFQEFLALKEEILEVNRGKPGGLLVIMGQGNSHLLSLSGGF